MAEWWNVVAGAGPVFSVYADEVTEEERSNGEWLYQGMLNGRPVFHLRAREHVDVWPALRRG